MLLWVCVSYRRAMLVAGGILYVGLHRVVVAEQLRGRRGRHDSSKHRVPQSVDRDTVAERGEVVKAGRRYTPHITLELPLRGRRVAPADIGPMLLGQSAAHVQCPVVDGLEDRDVELTGLDRVVGDADHSEYVGEPLRTDADCAGFHGRCASFGGRVYVDIEDAVRGPRRHPCGVMNGVEVDRLVWQYEGRNCDRRQGAHSHPVSGAELHDLCTEVRRADGTDVTLVVFLCRRRLRVSSVVSRGSGTRTVDAIRIQAVRPARFNLRGRVLMEQLLSGDDHERQVGLRQAGVLGLERCSVKVHELWDVRRIVEPPEAVGFQCFHAVRVSINGVRCFRERRLTIHLVS